MFKSILFGLGAGLLGLAGTAATPVVVTLLMAKLGAAVIVGLGAYRAYRRHQRRRASNAIPLTDFGRYG
jgi:hypothetical protein